MSDEKRQKIAKNDKMEVDDGEVVGLITQNMEIAELGIIGGTGFQETTKKFVDDPEKIEKTIVLTPYGETPQISLGKVNGKMVAFFPRHGFPSESARNDIPIPPHDLNAKACIIGLRMLGVKRIISISAVGGTHQEYKPGNIVVITDLLDLSFWASGHEGRGTFWRFNPDGDYDMRGEAAVDPDVDGKFLRHVNGKPIQAPLHTPMAPNPLCASLHDQLFAALKEKAKDQGWEDERVMEKGVYALARGPRFETYAETKALRQLGGDIVGMTMGPELTLCRELGMCYACLGNITNFSGAICGEEKDDHQEVIKRSEGMAAVVVPAVKKVISSITGTCEATCSGH